jgi:hypothetical protein
MFRYLALSAIMLILACGGSTGPSIIDISKVSVIETSNNSVETNIDLNCFNSEIHMDTAGEYAYVLSSYGNHVIQIDCQRQIVSSELDLGQHIYQCSGICLNDEGSELYAMVLAEGIYIVDIPSLSLVDSIEVDITSPYEMVHRPGTDLVYISLDANPNGTIVIDTELGMVVDTLPFVSYDLVFSQSALIDELYISDGTFLRCLDPDTGEDIVSVDTGHLINDVIFPVTGSDLYVSWGTVNPWDDGGIGTYDCFSLAQTRSIDLSAPVTHLCKVSNPSRIYARLEFGWYQNSILVLLDDPDLQVMDEFAIDPNLVDWAVDPTGAYVFCSIYANNETG